MEYMYCYLDRENGKILKFHLNNASYFKISTTFKHCRQVSAST